MTTNRIVTRALAFMIALACATAAAAQRFEIGSGEVITAGDPIEVSVLDLPPDTKVELRAERVLKHYYQRGFPIRRYEASALFRSDKNGRVNLATSPALGGSYEGADPSGLFRTMEVASEESVEADNEVTLTALIDGRVVATASFEMQTAAPTILVEEVPELPGSYFAAPSGPGKHPVIILVDGADDNRQSREMLMPQLVAKGYSVFHFATFALVYGPGKPSVEGLPTRYVDIPIDRLQLVRDWLIKREKVDADRMGLYGYSRNGAYVLLAATRFDWVKAVAGISPSDVVWEGWGDRVKQGTTSSYSWKGQPLDYVPYGASWLRETGKFGRGEQGRLRIPMDEGRWENPDRVQAARIPIETYKGALLVVGGEQDSMWSAGHMVQNVAERRAEVGLATSLLVLPDAGHNITSTGYNPTLLFEQGEARRIEALAQARTWAATLKFFREALKPQPHSRRGPSTRAE
ncbi:MAG: acyl-CoA thioester hydrolase/BAAT C-terminal domain-containing protein [Pseudomonadota bacterium]